MRDSVVVQIVVHTYMAEHLQLPEKLVRACCGLRSTTTRKQEQVRHRHHNHGHCQPEAVSLQVYNMIISGYTQQKNIDAATTMLETMALRGVVPNVVSYNSLVSCLCGAGRASHAHNIVQMAMRRGVTVDEWAWSAIIQVLLSQLLRFIHDFIICVPVCDLFIGSHAGCLSSEKYGLRNHINIFVIGFVLVTLQLSL